MQRARWCAPGFLAVVLGEFSPFKAIQGPNRPLLASMCDLVAQRAGFITRFLGWCLILHTLCTFLCVYRTNCIFEAQPADNTPNQAFRGHVQHSTLIVQAVYKLPRFGGALTLCTR
jgi:hypothetical protein